MLSFLLNLKFNKMRVTFLNALGKLHWGNQDAKDNF